jgi:hypothetical protein
MKTLSLLCRARSLARRIGDDLLRGLRSSIALDAVRELARGKSPLAPLALAEGFHATLGPDDLDSGGTIATLPRRPNPRGPAPRRAAVCPAPSGEGSVPVGPRLARQWTSHLMRTTPSPVRYL